MSHYRKLKTTFTNRVHLRAALKAADLAFEEARPGQSLTANGYGGQVQPATFVVRKQSLRGARYGDLGWQWDQEAGAFVQVEDDSDARWCRDTIQTVRREYAYAATVAQANAKGYQTKRIDLPSGEIQIQVTGRI